MKKLIGVIIVIALLSTSCRDSEYDRLVDRELASGVKHDSLFLTLHFGMKRKEFFDACWKMNKQGLMKQGPGNLSVEYELKKNELKADAYMRFYPNFNDRDEIYHMPVEFVYQAWAPWNKSLSADSLILDVEKLFNKWYPGEFIKLEKKDEDLQLWVKVNGNRRIRMYKKNDSVVKVEFMNLIELEKDADTKK